MKIISMCPQTRVSNVIEGPLWLVKELGFYAIDNREPMKSLRHGNDTPSFVLSGILNNGCETGLKGAVREIS